VNKTDEAEAAEKKRLKGIWWSKKVDNKKDPMELFEKFYAWYTMQEKKCCYCGITERELQELIDSGRITSKRLPTRGRHLEIERKSPDIGYDNFDNLSLACYWCNNAKTDTFTAAEFKQVGEVFSRIWQNRRNSKPMSKEC
jgi:hypothetical protein